MKPETSNYMFFENLKTIKSAIDSLLELDPEKVDELLKNGHDWAEDHITTSKDDIEEVANFLLNNATKKEQFGVIKTFESFINSK